MQQSHVFGARRLCIRNPRQAAQFEPNSIASLASVHVIPKGQDNFQHLLEALKVEKNSLIKSRT